MLKIFLGFLLFINLSGCSSFLYYPKKEFFYDPEKFNLKPEDIYFKNSEQEKLLHGWYFKSTAKKKKGFIVFFHGNGENLTSHYVTLLFVLGHGYDFFIFDYQGYGQSEGKPSPHGTILDGVAALKKAYELNENKPLIVYAQSLGGAVSLRSVHQVKKEIPIQMLLVDSTFHSYQEVAQDALSKTWLTWPLQWLSYLVLSDEYAPKKIIGEISPIPLIVLHGTKDQTVAYQFGQKVFELAKDPKEMWTIEDGRHIDSLWRKNGELREKFLEKLKTK